ncbi:MAG: hypothetical protein OEW64_02605 [Gammaproteobacteria bacterium]|nr:hypothetical protein [Gammaproteobacteria bacterium]MDH5302970.1 hypothetical protein [Gammaproteobacteria bacterium]MDH5321283.1 hypothetical protein [Gammaproteobacteria bacterium]
MNIRYFLGISAALLILDARATLAEESDVAADTGEARLLLQAGREEIIREEMRLSTDEDLAFWPVYDSYQSDLTIVRNRYAVLLSDYIQAYRDGAVSAEFAEKLVDEFLDIQSEILRIKKKHLKDFRKALPARKAARFYQLENKMDAELEGQLAVVVPLIDPV